MLTLADAEAKHESIKREMRRIRRAMRTQEDVEGLVEELTALTIECRALNSTLQRQREMAQFLAFADPYGGPQ